MRRVKRTCAALEAYGLLINVTDGRKHTFVLNGLSTYEGDVLTGINIQETKESKKKASSPCTPITKKENKEKKEKPLALDLRTREAETRGGERGRCDGSMARAREDGNGGKTAVHSGGDKRGACVEGNGGKTAAHSGGDAGRKMKGGSGSQASGKRQGTCVCGSVEERRQCFVEDLRPYVERYGKDMCNAFYNYWTELTQGGELMRFEALDVWTLENRLIAWARHGMKFDAKQGGKAKQAEIADSGWIDDAAASEQRRLKEWIETVPAWAIAEVKKHGLWDENKTAAGIYGMLEQLRVRKVLSVEALQLLERWKKARINVQKMLVNSEK